MRMRRNLLLCLALLTSIAWARPVPLDLGAGKQPALAAGRSGLHLVYESSDQHNDIYYRCQTGDSDWSLPVNLSHSPGVSSEPAVSVESDGSVDVVWSDTSSGADHPDIYFCRSVDGGKTWSEPLDISHTPRVSRSPRMAAARDGSLQAVWLDTSRQRGTPDVMGAFSLNHGLSWSKPEVISGASGASSSPSLAVASDGQIHCCWCTAAARPRLGYRYGQPGAWSKIRELGQGLCSQSQLAIARDRVYFSWIARTRPENSPNVYLCDSRHWQARNVSQTPGTSNDPSLAVKALKPIVAWIDTSLDARHPDVWMSEGGGRAFDLSHSPGISRKPSVAVQAGQTWVVWEELDRGECHLKIIQRKGH